MDSKKDDESSNQHQQKQHGLPLVPSEVEARLQKFASAPIIGSSSSSSAATTTAIADGAPNSTLTSITPLSSLVTTSSPGVLTRVNSSSSNSPGPSSPARSDTEHSSPSSRSASTGRNPSGPPTLRPSPSPTRRLFHQQSSPVGMELTTPVPDVPERASPQPSYSAYHQSNLATNPVHTLEQLVSPSSVLPSGMSAPPKRSFVATPSFPSPLARASIVPYNRSDTDEDEADKNQDVESLGSQDELQPSSTKIERSLSRERATAAAASGPAAKHRRSSSVRLVSGGFRFGGARSTSPNMMSMGAGGNLVSTSPEVGSGSNGGGGPDLNALGLSTTRDAGSHHSKEGSSGGNSFESDFKRESPPRSRRLTSDFLQPGADARKLSGTYPAALSVPRPIPKSAAAMLGTSPAVVSPLSTLPSPWGSSSSSSSMFSSSPTHALDQQNPVNTAIRLQRVPTSVRLASDMMPPASTVPMSNANRKASTTSDFFVGSVPSLVTYGSSRFDDSDPAVPGTPSATRWPTPEDSPDINLNNPNRTLPSAGPPPMASHTLPIQQSALFAGLGFQESPPSSLSRSGSSPRHMATTGSGSFSRPRPSLLPPSAYDPVTLPPSTSDELAPNRHQRFRTSVHEATIPLAVSLGTVDPKSNSIDLQRQDGSRSDLGHDDYAKIIMQSRSAKMQKWRRHSSQHSVGSISRPAPMDRLDSVSGSTPPGVNSNNGPEADAVYLRHTVALQAAASSNDLNRSYGTVPSDSEDAAEERRAAGLSRSFGGDPHHLERLPSSAGSAPRNFEWVDWLEEYKQKKEAAIRSEAGFTGSISQQGLSSRAASMDEHAVDLGEESSLARSGSPEVFYSSPPVGSQQECSPHTDPLALSPTTSHVHHSVSNATDGENRRRSFNSLEKSNSQRKKSLFSGGQLRHASGSSTVSRESLLVDNNNHRRKRNVVSKIEGWWNSVKSTLSLEHPHGDGTQLKRTSIPTGAIPITAEDLLTRPSPVASPIKSTHTSAATTTNVTTIPSLVRGFAPMNPPIASPQATLRNVTSNYDLSSTRVEGGPYLAPPATISLKGRVVSQGSSFPSQSSSSAISGGGSSGHSDETMSRGGPQTASLEARRRQPRLSLNLDRSPLQLSSVKQLPVGYPQSNNNSGSSGSPYMQPVKGDSSSSGSQATKATKTAPWAQTPSPLVNFNSETPGIHQHHHHPPLDTPGNPTMSSAAMHREIRQRLTAQKEICNKELQKILQHITVFVEEKMREHEEAVIGLEEFEGPSVFSAMDSQSDFGDESDRGETSLSNLNTRHRAHSRRSSMSRPSVGPGGSPIKKREELPMIAGSPGRRRSSVLPGSLAHLRAHGSAPAFRMARSSNVNMNRDHSSSSSRSNSRSRSPLPPPLPHLGDPLEIATQTALPADFLKVVQEIIDIATEVIDTPISTLTAEPGHCPAIVNRAQALGNAWEEHSDWPGRTWYISLLLAVAGLSRVVEWWEAEKGFWNFAASEEDAEPLTFVLKPDQDRKLSLPGSEAATMPNSPGIPSSVDTMPSIAAKLELPEMADGEQTAKPEAPVEDLRQKVEQALTVSIVMELSLSGDIVEWINPAWEEVVGTDPLEVLGQSINDYLAPADVSVFAEATQALLKDASHTVQARFRLMVLRSEDDFEPGPKFDEMEGSGMLMNDRMTGIPSHTMWVIKPVPQSQDNAPEPSVIGEPPATAGLGLGMFPRAADAPLGFPQGSDFSMTSVLCRICERQVPAWYFEKHNETCHEVHRLEADIADRNEQANDLLAKAVELLGSLQALSSSTPSQYRGVPLLTLSRVPSPVHSTTTEGSLSLSSPARQSEPIQPLQVLVIKEVIEVLKMVIDISTPSIKEESTEIPIEQQRLLSPHSESNLSFSKTWTKPLTEDASLNLLIEDAAAAVRNKINAINRLRNTIVYSERVRHEWEEKVEKTLAALSEEGESNESDVSLSQSGHDEQSGGEDEQATGTATTPSGLSQATQPLQPSPTFTTPDLSLTSAFFGLPPTTNSTASTTAIQSEPPTLSKASAATTAPRRFSRQKSFDPSFLSTPPLSPSVGAHNSTSPNRQRALSSGRLSLGMDAPSSPRLPSVTPASRSTPISIKDFEIIKPISKGAFGSVYLTRKRATGDYFAMKVLKKSDMISKNQITNVKAERKILMNQAESPYVVRLFFTFQNSHYLFLVMEYLNGGDCAALIKTLGGLPEEWVRSYIAEVVLGLESLHEKGIVHRDLKPDNLLIDAKGHLKLTDFGLSRIGLLGRQAGGSRFTVHRGASQQRSRGRQRPTMSRAASASSTESPLLSPESAMPNPPPLSSLSQSYFNQISSADESSGSEGMSGVFHRSKKSEIATKSSPDSGTPASTAGPESHKFVGTVDYVAPESILGLGGDNVSVDWWALGVIMYEFLYGIPPFNDSTAEKVFDNIVSRRIHWPDDEDYEVSPEARDLMERLMCLDPMKRLGSRGAHDIKRHAFFQGIDWSTISIAPSAFIPQNTDALSTDYFDARGLVELPEEFSDLRHALNDAVEGTAPGAAATRLQPPSADDFGAFTFRNLSASKAANDQVVQEMKATAALLPASSSSSEISAILSPHERRKSITQRKRPKGPFPPGDPRAFLAHPPSPATSATSSSSSNLPVMSPGGSGGGGNGHFRRTSDVERIREAENDIIRRSSLPSRLRTASVSVSSTGDGGSSSGLSSALSPPSTASSPNSSSVTQPTPKHSRVHALLAEDNPVSMKIAFTILTKLGIECATVTNGSDALAVASACPFDVLFFDLRLPHMDGDYVARYLKSVVGPNSETPIVAVTSFTEEEVFLSEQGTLFSAVVSKPVSKESLLKVLLKLGFKVGATVPS